ncbi:acyltransferase family protein [Hymenobacter psoromatis]|uniref:acyltransferase family protein n=1 Tax=Hymenobacter psoromatis TaxID=1484116 RepID=UPI001CBD57B6|nr:acyltransferase [Hymenobacter psoromatis]
MALSTTQPLKTKQHFELLDGLRGVAAVAVVIFHFMEFAIPDYTHNFIAHGYLAVDFFFCLSGFVIAYAYDNRINAMGMVEFCKLRLIRLHPLVIIGSVLGLIFFLLDPYSNLAAKYSASQLVTMFMASCLLIPYPVVLQRSANLFHLNPPTWSLFWEYIANIFYVLILFKLSNKLLWLIVSCAALLLCYEAHHVTYLGVGWGKDNFWGGGIRILYSFPIGMLIYRSNWIVKSRLGFISLGFLLFIAFLIPYSTKTNWLADSLIVLFYFPFLVALGAGASAAAPLQAICRFSGEISYPLYMIHYPFLWIFLSYVEKNKPSLNQMTLIILIAAVLLIMLAYSGLKFLDVPIRAYLKRYLKKSENP